MSIRKTRKQIHFHSKQRWAITIILLIIIGVLAYGKFTTWNHVNSPYNGNEHEAILERINTKKESIRNEKIEASKPRTIRPHRFNPNTISKEELISMGLNERDAKSWTNYTSKGGKFYKKEDLNRLYSMNDKLYNQLAPFVDIPKSPRKKYPVNKKYDKSSNSNRDYKNKYTSKKSYATADSLNFKSTISEEERNEYNRNFKESRNTRSSGIADDFVISINTTDSTELQVLDGIGPVLSARIIKYRDQLGGFHNMNQLLEVYGVKPALVSQIIKRLNFEGEMHKIDLNTIEVKELVKHPYFDYATANIFINYRSHHGDFNSIEDIKKIRVIKNYWLEEAEPYFSYTPSNNISSH